MKTQPLVSAAHVVTLPFEFEQKVAPPPPTQLAGVGSHVQSPVGLEPVHVVCVGHVTVEATKKQPSPSLPQIDFVDVDWQNVVVSLAQLGSTLHWQVAAPAAPVHVVCAPQATGAAVAKKQRFEGS
jgi:hypothetical protein